MSYQHQQKQRRRRSAKKRENRKHQKQRSRMLASRRTKEPQTLPKPKDKIEKKTMNKNEVIESLAIFFYNSIQKNEKPRRRRRCPVQTAPSIFSDFRALSPAIPEIRVFIETIFEKRRLAAESGVVALVLFSRAGVKINSSNWMRLILVILLLANKEAEDVYSVWNVRFVGIIPNVPVYEINLLELEFLKYLKYRLHVESLTYQKFYNKLVALLPEKTSEDEVEKSAEDDIEEENIQKEETEEPSEENENFEEENIQNEETKEPLEENENIEISDEELYHTSDDELLQFEEIKISDPRPSDLTDCHEMYDESIP